MVYEFYKVKRQTECRGCRKDICVRKHMIEINGSQYCLNCGSDIIEKHRREFKREIAKLNKIRRTLKRHSKERITLKMVD